MRLIIDIPDKVYNRVRSLEPRKDGVMILDTLMCAVQDGTPLPWGYTIGLAGGFDKTLEDKMHRVQIF